MPPCHMASENACQCHTISAEKPNTGRYILTAYPPRPKPRGESSVSVNSPLAPNLLDTRSVSAQRTDSRHHRSAAGRVPWPKAQAPRSSRLTPEYALARRSIRAVTILPLAQRQIAPCPVRTPKLCPRPLPPRTRATHAELGARGQLPRGFAQQTRSVDCLPPA